MKRIAEIIKRIKEIQEIVTRGEATDELSTELDTLLEEKRGLEDKETEMRLKFEEGLKMPKISKRIAPIDADMEYRQAFMDYVMGKSDDILKRVDATTKVTDIGAVIPTTVMNKIVEEMKDYGEIYAMITKTNYPGGLEIPTASAKPTASWVAESTVADKQKKALGKISFSYYKLQIRVAISLMADSVSLAIFESTISSNIAEAMVVAIEVAVLNGTGTGQPLGITVDPLITNRPAFAVADATWQGWKVKFINKIPLAYRKKRNGVILCNPLTWDKYMDGMVDQNDQPLARITVGINGEEVLRFMGKKVILRDEILDLDAAIVVGVDTPFLIYGNLKDYLFNSNLQIATRRYFDEDTDEYIQKSTLLADGKVADPHGFVVLQTPAA